MTGERLTSGEAKIDGSDQVLGQLDMFIDAEQADIENDIRVHESLRPSPVDPINKQVEYDENAAKLEGRATELARFRNWRNSLQ